MSKGLRRQGKADSSIGREGWGAVRPVKRTRTTVICLQEKALGGLSEALKWMPERGDKFPDDLVFALPSGDEMNRLLKPWAKAAGINKRWHLHTSLHQ